MNQQLSEIQGAPAVSEEKECVLVARYESPTDGYRYSCTWYIANVCEGWLIFHNVNLELGSNELRIILCTCGETQYEEYYRYYATVPVSYVK